jgi:hypothetical protein
VERVSIREYVEAVRGRYSLVSKKDKDRILDESSEVTACHWIAQQAARGLLVIRQSVCPARRTGDT